MTQVTLDPSSHRSSAPIAGGLTGAMLGRALGDAVVKLNPTRLLRNPVIFATWIVALLATVSAVVAVVGGQAAGFAVQLALWLWATVLFANVAESIAEGRGKAAADSLRATRVTTKAKLIVDPKTGTVVPAPAGELEIGSIVLVEAGDVIPSDGEIIEGVASVNEAAITGESAPVIRESGGDRSAVTGGTQVLSDWIRVRITAAAGSTFLDRMISLVEGAERQKTPNEIALNILLAGMTLIFVLATATIPSFATYAGGSIPIIVLVAQLIGVAPGQFIAVVALTQLSESLQHANLRLWFGRWGERLWVSPRFHRRHHSIGIGHETVRPSRVVLGGCNFGVLFPWWDMLFRTASWERTVEPTGIRDQLPAPEGRSRRYGRGVVAQQVRAFGRIGRRLAPRRPAI